MAPLHWILAAAGLLMLVSGGEAISCYNCSSSITAACNSTEGVKSLTPVACKPGQVCHKNQIDIYARDRKTGRPKYVRTRISRFCGGVYDEKPNFCSQTMGGEGYHTQCSCDKQGCNTAPSLYPVAMTTVSTVLVCLRQLW